MEEKKVAILHYPQRKTKEKTQAIERKIGVKVLGELERLGLDVRKLKCRSFLAGKVLMYYNEDEFKPETLSINGTVYRGNVVFVGMNEGKPTDLTAARKGAIRAVVNRLGGELC